MKKNFRNIIIQFKSDIDDFRSFINVTDSEGNDWELRGYGKTAGEAADDAWKRYQDDEIHWDIYGEIREIRKNRENRENKGE